MFRGYHMMSVFSLSLKSMHHRKWSILLTICSITLGFMLLFGVFKLQKTVKSSFERAIANTDLIVGAATGPVNLLLYAMYRIGDPLSNIDYSLFASLRDDHRVSWAIPLSMGDSHRGYRVLGTTADYFEHYRLGEEQEALKFEFGNSDGFATRLETVVLGFDVAKNLGYTLGDRITISHGVDQVFSEEHTNMLFEVIGILAPTATSVDQSLHVSLASLEAVHAGWNNVNRPPADKLKGDELRFLVEDPKQISVMMLSLKSKLHLFELQREINDIPGYQGILPGVAFGEFWSMLEVSDTVLRIISWLMVLCTFLGLICSMLTTISYRQREMAIYRSLGSSPWFISYLLVCESMVCVVVSCIIGYFLSMSVLYVATDYLMASWGVYLDPASLLVFEWKLVFAVIGLGFCVGWIPAYFVYRRSLNQSLIVSI